MEAFARNAEAGFPADPYLRSQAEGIWASVSAQAGELSAAAALFHQTISGMAEPSLLAMGDHCHYGVVAALVVLGRHCLAVGSGCVRGVYSGHPLLPGLQDRGSGGGAGKRSDLRGTAKSGAATSCSAGCADSRRTPSSVMPQVFGRLPDLSPTPFVDLMGAPIRRSTQEPRVADPKSVAWPSCPRIARQLCCRSHEVALIFVVAYLPGSRWHRLASWQLQLVARP